MLRMTFIIFISVFEFRFCVENKWTPSLQLNCSTNNCPLVEAIYNYAKDNIVLFNIFIKVAASP